MKWSLGLATILTAAACGDGTMTGTSPAGAACASPIGLSQSLTPLEGDCTGVGNALVLQTAGGVLGKECAARSVSYPDEGCTLEFEGRSCVTVTGDAVSSVATLHAQADGTWRGVAEISVRAHTGPFDQFDDPRGAAVSDCAGTFLIELAP